MKPGVKPQRNSGWTRCRKAEPWKGDGKVRPQASARNHFAATFPSSLPGFGTRVGCGNPELRSGLYSVVASGNSAHD